MWKNVWLVLNFCHHQLHRKQFSKTIVIGSVWWSSTYATSAVVSPVVVWTHWAVFEFHNLVACFYRTSHLPRHIIAFCTEDFISCLQLCFSFGCFTFYSFLQMYATILVNNCCQSRKNKRSLWFISLTYNIEYALYSSMVFASFVLICFSLIVWS